MNKRLLTLDDLYNFYSSTNNSQHFSAKDENDKLVVQVSGNLAFENDSDDSDGLRPVVLKACHTNLNRNGSYISEEVMTAALPSFSNRPILGCTYKDENGEWQFNSHNMHINEDEELIYDEVPVGIVPESCNAHLEKDEEHDRQYVVINGYLYEEYSKAVEILEREGKCDVSVELSIRELSYNAKEKYLNIEDFFYSGVTILGRNPETGEKVQPGMEGSNIQLASFSQENNSVFAQENIIKLLEELKTKVDSLVFNIENSQEGGIQEMFDSLLEKYNKTAEDVTFDYENMSDEELEAKFEEVFGTEKQLEEEETEVEETEVEEAETSEEVESTEEPEAEAEPENYTKTFELSHDDIRYALYTLLAPYEESDNDWYGICQVFDDHFIYQGWCTGNFYDQKYSKDGDIIEFNGERVQMYSIFVTESEKVALDEMRANYSSISEKLAKYEAEPEKMSVLNSEEYGYISNAEEFVELKKQENHFDLTVEEVKNKANEILLSYAKAQAFSINTNDEAPNKVAFKSLEKVNKKPSRYGNLFNR